MHARLETCAGVVNGYAYLPPEQLTSIGVTLTHGFGQTGMVLVRGAVARRRAWMGSELLMFGYKERFGWDLGPGMIFHARTDARFKYFGPVLEWELTRSDSLGWRIFLSGGCGVAVQSWRVRITQGSATTADYKGSEAAFAGGGGICGLRRIAATYGIAIAAGGLVSREFASVSVGPTREDYLGHRQVYAVGGLYREF